MIITTNPQVPSRTFTLTLLLISAAAFVSGARDRYAAFPALPNGLIPRYFIDNSIPILVERDGICSSGSHPCDQIGHPQFCCSNENYCFINKDGDPKCCVIGSNCEVDSNCNSLQYQCTFTQTLKASDSSSSSRSGTRRTALSTARPSISTSVACCPRACAATSQYKCPASLGGGCCQYGLNCADGGKCVGAVTKSSATFTGAVTPVASGCTTSQFRCDDGMGCCDNGQSCTDIDGTGYCAAASPTDSGMQIQEGNGGLSSGAKAGIAVGVIVGCGLVILAITYLFITKRKQKRQRAEGLGASGGSGGRQQDRSATGLSGDDLSNTYPGGFGAPMSETASNRPRAGPGLTQDYFGPDAVPGPYTQMNTRPGESPALDRAVNLTPHGPGDIAAPVELGSDGARSPMSSNKDVLSPTSPLSRYETPPGNTMEPRFELPGSAPVAAVSSTGDLPPPQHAESSGLEEMQNSGHGLDGRRKPVPGSTFD